jgi:hypothetical protein
MSNNESSNGEINVEDRFASAGMLAVGVVIIVGFLPIGFANISSDIVILAFAMSIPLSATYLFCCALFPAQQVYDAKQTTFALWGGVFTGIVGVISAFWYLCWKAGVLFLLASLVGLVLILSMSRKRTQ